MTLMRGECLAKRHTPHRFVNPTTHERLKSPFSKAVLYPSNCKEVKYQDFTSALESDLERE
jgi:hypothetical protein